MGPYVVRPVEPLVVRSVEPRNETYYVEEDPFFEVPLPDILHDVEDFISIQVLQYLPTTKGVRPKRTSPKCCQQSAWKIGSRERKQRLNVKPVT